ncbi:TIGR02281 family clan AA aspartic protease [Candidatus Omnitrophota bacterium]
MKRVIFVLLALTINVYGICALAETIVLKNGEKVIAKVLKETDEAVVISKGGGSFVSAIARTRIKLIRESTPAELAKEEGKKAESEKNVKKALFDRKAQKTLSGKGAHMERYETQVGLAKKARGRIKIKFSEGRQGVVDTLLNGKVTAALLVDTGASMIVISGDVARKLGIDYANIDERITVVLADGSQSTAVPITLESVQVGSSAVKDVKAAISEDGPGGDIDGLLGMTFLGYFHVKLDTKENCLVLEKY